MNRQSGIFLNFQEESLLPLQGGFIGLLLCGMCTFATSIFAVEAPPLLSPPAYEVVREKCLSWIREQREVSVPLREQVEARWQATDPGVSSDQLWEETLRTFADLDPATGDFLKSLQNRDPLPRPVTAQILFEAQRGDFYLSNLRLHYARWLVQRELSDLALGIFEQINPAEVISPAAFLFYKASCQRQLLLRKEGLATIEALLRLPQAPPERYFQLARLMQEEWKAVEDKSLEEVSLLMQDVQRRLKLAQPGQRTQNVEEQVISRLDELIKKLEDEQKGNSSSEASGSSNSRSTNPADDSRIKGATAPGNVDPKSMKGGDAWGNLDEKERAKVQNLISREFPAHYRQTIEEYFRKLATRKSAGE